MNLASGNIYIDASYVDQCASNDDHPSITNSLFQKILLEFFKNQIIQATHRHYHNIDKWIKGDVSLNFKWVREDT